MTAFGIQVNVPNSLIPELVEQLKGCWIQRDPTSHVPHFDGTLIGIEVSDTSADKPMILLNVGVENDYGYRNRYRSAAFPLDGYTAFYVPQQHSAALFARIDTYNAEKRAARAEAAS